jgi:phospholipid/cholesterol/gamma-HCH transport system permease protein
MGAKNFFTFESQQNRLMCQSEWDVAHLASFQTSLDEVAWPKMGEIIIDGQAITKLDSAGAWLLSDWVTKLSNKKLTVQLQNFSEKHQALLLLIQKQLDSMKVIPTPVHLKGLARFGKFSYLQFIELTDFLSFIGKLSVESLSLLIHPTRWRWRAIINTIDQTGFHALLIIALMSFMIGVVITYQMGNQLRTYGANVFVVDLLGLSILREFGPLLTAIMVAGRTGSAFAAQLGIMKINQEVDALNTMGIPPAYLLLLPRILGLLVALPLLTIWSDIFGVIGGMVMAKSMLGVGWLDFLFRFQHQIPLKTLLIGLGKAPVFALIIACIGCFEGMEVQGSAESVGKRTTRSVVLGIFFIIIVDAIFSVLFSWLNL